MIAGVGDVSAVVAVDKTCASADKRSAVSMLDDSSVNVSSMVVA
jgi:hypothetical protein